LKLVVRPEAEADLTTGFQWYEEQLPGLGHDFLAIVYQQLQRILERPEGYPRLHPRLRRSLTPRFPYAIFYLVAGDTVVVIAVLHQASDPRHWQSRA
jgi:toxin ParE1/3/4